MCGACRRVCGRLATVWVERHRLRQNRAAQGAQMASWPGSLQLQQLLTQGGVVAEQLLLLLQQGGEPLAKTGLKQGRQLLEQRLHGRDPLTGVGKGPTLRFQLSVTKSMRVRIHG